VTYFSTIRKVVKMYFESYRQLSIDLLQLCCARYC